MTAHSVTARLRASIPSVHMLSRSGELRFATKTRFSGVQMFVNPKFTGISSKSGFAAIARTTSVAFGTPSTMPALTATSFSASRLAEQRALRKLALGLAKPRWGFLAAAFAAEPLINRFYKRVIAPTGFPGFGNFTDGWTSNAGAPWPGIVPGEYTINGFDVSQPWGAAVPNMVDANDGDIFGLRYWGHYDADPFPDGAPGIDWERRTQVMPTTRSARVRYRKLADQAAVQTVPWHPRQNVTIRLDTTFRTPIRIELDTPRIRDRGDKAKPANMIIYSVLKKFANVGGETKEMADIFAEASGYIKGSMMLPVELRDTGKETQAKLYWLFYAGGMDVLDFEQLFELLRYNVLEDMAFGIAGRMSKFSAQGLGLTVGPQTGLVM